MTTRAQRKSEKAKKDAIRLPQKKAAKDKIKWEQRQEKDFAILKKRMSKLRKKGVKVLEKRISGLEKEIQTTQKQVRLTEDAMNIAESMEQKRESKGPDIIQLKSIWGRYSQDLTAKENKLEELKKKIQRLKTEKDTADVEYYSL